MFLFNIGNNTNPYTGLEILENAEEDAEAVRRAFSRHPFNVPDDRMKVLLGSEATRENILSGFQWLREDENIRFGDAIVIYFAGHSQSFRLSEVCGGVPGYVSAICSYDTLTGKGGAMRSISSREINILLQPLYAKTKNVTVILDSCYSGRGTRGPTPDKLTTGLLSVLEYARATAINLGACPGADNDNHPHNPLSLAWKGFRNHTLLAACRWDRIAFDGVQNGEFTSAFLKVLRRPDLKMMTGKDVVLAVRKEMNRLPQVPHWDGDGALSFVFDGVFARPTDAIVRDSPKPRQRTMSVISSVGSKLRVFLGGISGKTLFLLHVQYSV
jgi:hypothetical protein